MKNKKVILTVALCMSSLSIYGSGFSINPWVDSFLNFDLDASFLYRKYNKVNGGYNPSSYSSNDRFTQLDVKGVVYPDVELEFLVEFADTRKQRLGTQSAGFQGRYQFLDDRRGDFLAWTSSFNIRYVSARSLQDVSCPYHSRLNFELGQSIGKEFDFSEVYSLNPYTFFSIGQGIKGLPWIRSITAFEFLIKQLHTIAPFVDGYFGFGKTHKVNISSFFGYGTIFHQSVDVGFYYRFDFSKIWGSFSLYYAYRAYAKNYPSGANTFILYYKFPFSVF